MRISVDETGVEAIWRDGRRARMVWPAVVHIALAWIPRDDMFFWQDPCYWELQADSGARLPIYSRAARRLRLLDALERLPGFDRETAERALARRAPGSVAVWSRRSVGCPSCGRATLAERKQEGKLRYERRLLCPRCGYQLALGRARFYDDEQASD